MFNSKASDKDQRRILLQYFHFYGRDSFWTLARFENVYLLISDLFKCGSENKAFCFTVELLTLGDEWAEARRKSPLYFYWTFYPFKKREREREASVKFTECTGGLHWGFLVLLTSWPHVIKKEEQGHLRLWLNFELLTSPVKHWNYKW